MLPLVLIDATPVETDSGTRGIGRFVTDLLTGLARTQAAWRGLLRLRFLVHLGRAPWWVTVAEPTHAREQLDRHRARHDYRFARRRRRWLGMASHWVGADLLHMTEAVGMPWTASVPRLVTCHDLIRLELPEQYLTGSRLLRAGRYRRHWAREHQRYATARRIVAISERSRQALVRQLGLPLVGIDRVPNGVDLSRFAPPEGLLRPSRTVPESERAVLAELGIGTQPYALYVGGGDPRKNARTMMAALARARRDVPLRLVWAGELPPKEAAPAVELARRYGVVDHVKQLGYVPDAILPVLYRNAVAHLFLSRSEGFGLTVVEAMASGCPVVVARGSGVDELVAGDGVVVHPDDALSAGRWLVRLATTPALRAAMAMRGLERASGFGCEVTALGYVTSYLRALGRLPAGSTA